ncbi:MAG: ABC transporter substrate-binding protein [Acetobacteraceae bacterium]|nr:ABC transporter substrate-binding protein [Acetobacteraceae bacterium]
MTGISRRHMVAGSGALAMTAASARALAETVGVTKTEIKIGNTSAYSGPASAYSTGAKSFIAFFDMINEQGGVNGRKIKIITLDDGYVPSKTVEVVRRLVEQDQVAFIAAPLGTAPNSAIQKYLNQKKVPQLFLASGADKFADPQNFPWTIGWAPSYRTEGQIYAKYIMRERPNAKIGVIYQNDDLGKDYVLGLKDVFGKDYDKKVIKQVSYEVTDPTVDSQVLTLKDSGADALVSACTPKFAAQLIRRAYDIAWQPLHCMSNVSASVGTVMKPAGPEKGIGIITSAYIKDASDPAWKDDPGVIEFKAFSAKYNPTADMGDSSNVVGYGYAITTLQVLQQCGEDLSRENIMRQAANIRDLDPKILFPGIMINTSPTNFRPIRKMQLTRWNGTIWEIFGELLEGAPV